MLERTVRIVAITLSLVVALGFILFALDDVDRASDSKVDEIASYQQADPTPAGERDREQRHGKLREAIDDANDILLKSFAGVSDSASSRWVQRGVPALFGCSSTASDWASSRASRVGAASARGRKFCVEFPGAQS